MPNPCTHLDYLKMICPNPTTLAALSGTIIVDMDYVTNKMGSLKKIHDSEGKAFHIYHRDVIKEAAPYSSLNDIGYTSLHVLHDEIVDLIVEKITPILKKPLSMIIRREATEEDVHSLVDMYMEYKKIEKKPNLRYEMLDILEKAPNYYDVISALLTLTYTKKGYDVNMKSFRRAMSSGCLLTKSRLRSMKYMHYLPKLSRKRKQKLFLGDIFLKFLIEDCNGDVLLNGGTGERLIGFIDEFEENINVIKKLGQETREALEDLIISAEEEIRKVA